MTIGGHRALLGVVSLIVALAGPSAITVASPDSDPVTDAARSVFPIHRKNITASFSAMPEDKFGFRPTAELMTFAELAIHIGSAHVYYCRRLGGPDPADIVRPKAGASKADLTMFLQSTLDYCAPLVESARDATLGDAVTLPSGKITTRAQVLLDLISGMDHHYAQAAGYLRLNGVLPPTASPAK
jgi:uncharacterized damage-inducible protein DinB